MRTSGTVALSTIEPPRRSRAYGSVLACALALIGCGDPAPPEAAAALFALRTGACLIVHGEVHCWGYSNDFYPDAVPDESHTPCTNDGFAGECVGFPAVLDDLAGATTIYAGDHTDGGNCAAFPDGEVRCWGEFVNLRGAGSMDHFEAPQAIPSLLSAKSIALESAHRCAVSSAGVLRCWGANDFGQVGAPPSPYEDVALAQLGPVKQVDTSDSHTCAVNEVDEVWCWGENSYGQVGERGAAIPCGEGFCSPTPSRVDGVARVREVAVSSVHSCVLTDDGRVLCWGYNEDGNLGDGSGVSTPTEVVGLPGEVIALDVGRNGHFGAPTCVVVESGAVYCWGGDSVLTYVTPPDELEVNVYGVCQCAYAPVPVLINLPIPARDVSIGLFHACALGGGAAGPVVSCWGGPNGYPILGCGFEGTGPFCTNLF